MRQPEEIKKGLMCIARTDCGFNCDNCEANVPGYGSTDACVDALDYIQQLEAQVPRWTKAKEPPKEWVKNGKKRVLINYLVNMPEYRVDVGNWIEPAGKWVVMGLPANVTHWMPLPEEPKEET